MPRRFVRTLSVCAVAGALVLTGCSSNDRGAERTPTQSSANSSTSSSSSSSTSSTLARGDLNAANVKLTKIASPTSATAMTVREGDDALYLTEQVGRVRAVRGGRLDPTNVVDLQSVVGSGGERGLLGLTFSKDGSKLYVDFTDKSGNTHIAELTMRADGTADPASRKDLLAIAQPQANHNGGNVILGPDGMLYVGMGDGGAAGDQGSGHVAGGNGQSTNTLLGKLLRIDPTPSADKPYSIPADNPFVAGGGRPEIWAYGLRNPWRFSFDKATGDLWIGDVGQNAWEEIDFARAKHGGRRELRLERVRRDAPLPRRRRAGRGEPDLRVPARRSLRGQWWVRLPRQQDPGPEGRVPLLGLVRRLGASDQRGRRQDEPVA